MADDKRDNLPELLDEDGPNVDLADTGVRSFRSRVEKFALPSVMALAVAAGLVFGGIAPDGADNQALTAAPAAVTSDINRAVDGTSRSGERTPAEAEAADPTPEAAPTEEAPAEEAPAEEAPAEEDARKNLVNTETKALSAISKEPTASASASATSSGSKLYATEKVNVRDRASASSERIGSVDKGDSVNSTGQTSNGFTEVSLNGRKGWVSSQFLSRTAPAAAPAAPSSSSASRSASSGSSAAAPAAPAPRSNGNCPIARGVTPRAAALNQAICDRFPSVRSYGGYRAGDSGAHGSGRALDVMVTGATGTEIANWARANAGAYGITEVIWQQRIWTTQRSGEGWRGMSDRGGATANHFDHVHITLR
ncbi:SH3 domain-containing protein [Ammonicoccus fulvus]|uniref:SH3 domain-containing protein n=1 Tax=Ammonicoccus fulvus TaxID=3138240 RepID=A0ABZ3FID7_9ACTN